MKKLFTFLASFMMIITMAISQKDAKLTIEISNDSVLLGNYIEVKVTVENAQVKNFEAPDFGNFNILSGPNQASSMMISNGEVSQSVTYSYLLEPLEVGSYFIPPAYVDTDKETLETVPIEVIVVDNPDGIIQNPHQNRMNDLFNGGDFFNQEDFFGGNPFMNGSDFFKEFFDQSKQLFPAEIEPFQPKQKKKKKKKAKVYRL